MKDKIARICWNTEGWIRPSGEYGKSKNKKAYESKTGYGHEEWLLDISKLIGGYHYGYLQAVGQHRDTYVGKVYDVSLYSINSDTKDRWFIGAIHNLCVIDEKESKSVFKTYKQNGWYIEMKNQLQNIGADADHFTSIPPKNFAVVKFKPENLKLLDEPHIFERTYIRSDYYNLKNLELKLANILPDTKFKFRSGHHEYKKARISSYQSQQSKVIDLLHNKIQTAMYNQLSKRYGKQNVGTENDIGNGCRIDAIVQHNDGNFTLYEIKTGYSALMCIREAFGQLMEYAHFYDDIQIGKLIVVSPHFPTEAAKQYMSKLREKYHIPIHYQRFNFEKNELAELC